MEAAIVNLGQIATGNGREPFAAGGMIVVDGERIATGAPTNSGIMPLGMLCTIVHLASLTDIQPEHSICAATDTNAKVYGLDSCHLAPGKGADIVLPDAPNGGTQRTSLAAIRHADIAAVGGVIAAGTRFVGRSRNRPSTRKARVATSPVTQDVSATAH